MNVRWINNWLCNKWIMFLQIWLRSPWSDTFAADFHCDVSLTSDWCIRVILEDNCGGWMIVAFVWLSRPLASRLIIRWGQFLCLSKREVYDGIIFRLLSFHFIPLLKPLLYIRFTWSPDLTPNQMVHIQQQLYLIGCHRIRSNVIGYGCRLKVSVLKQINQWVIDEYSLLGDPSMASHLVPFDDVWCLLVFCFFYLFIYFFGCCWNLVTGVFSSTGALSRLIATIDFKRPHHPLCAHGGYIHVTDIHSSIKI